MTFEIIEINYFPNFLKKWPILNHPMCWSLIVEDFEYLNFHATENGINYWPQFFLNIQKICPLQKKKTLRAR